MPDFEKIENSQFITVKFRFCKVRNREDLKAKARISKIVGD